MSPLPNLSARLPLRPLRPLTCRLAGSEQPGAGGAGGPQTRGSGISWNKLVNTAPPGPAPPGPAPPNPSPPGLTPPGPSRHPRGRVRIGVVCPRPGRTVPAADSPGLPWVPEPLGQAGSAPHTSVPGRPSYEVYSQDALPVTPSSTHRAAAVSGGDVTRTAEGAPRRPARPGACPAPQETASQNARPHTPRGHAAGPQCPDPCREDGSDSSSRTKTPRGLGRPRCRGRQQAGGRGARAP